ncbi:ethylbenzene dehydrogenase-related protein [Candidatus Nitronereus thalassa]|uniref:Ethylbenzene dehydrogenase-related protein n=1 Tax=Candidatus Nitronereus thalassa TaxID=3020898 RepID=A0ABU3KCM9_9BACT|nr:ethylbenzene dehydrogenase-related protein [Candidatus Nitronereus thalassa]MDT7044148.1 ethylbenzene dehydrogenase-related protein [Candidatus Nitronereus thalassa]
MKIRGKITRFQMATGLGIVVVAMVLGWFEIPVVSSQGIVIRSHFREGEVPSFPSDKDWESLAPIPIPLSGQIITRPVWPEPSAKVISVRSIHNGQDISFLIEWQDATKNEQLTPGVFRDGAALALPLGDAPAFFCMGQLDHYVNIWHWKADWQSDVDRRAARAKERKRQEGGIRRFEVIPRRPSSVEDLIGGGFSTLTSKSSQGTIKGQAEWKNGFWRVVMKRPLTQQGDDKENEATLIPGRMQAVSFAVWNGEYKERNGQKAVASWLQLLVDPVGGPPSLQKS